jgi:NTE family protein
MSKTRINLALGGGGVRGLAHLGALSVLEEHFTINGIVGTSIGAILGGLYALGHTPSELRVLAHTLRLSRFTSLFSLDLEMKGLVNGRGLREYLRELTGGHSIADCRIPFIAVSYDLRSRCTLLHTEGDLALAMRASSSLPMLFRPVIYGDRVIVDGGIEHPLPVEYLPRLPEADLTVAVNVLSPVKMETHDLSIEAGKVNKRRHPGVTAVGLETLRCNQGFLAQHALRTFPVDIPIQASMDEGGDLMDVEEFYRIGAEAARKALRKVTAVHSTP